MKAIKLFLFLVSGLLPMMSTAQSINNAGIEQWDTTGNYSDPKGYSSSNALLSTIPGNSIYTLNPTTDAHGGKYAALLQTKYYLFLGSTIPGLLTNGKLRLDSSSSASGIPTFSGGQAFSKRITHLSFWYKHVPVAKDTMYASVYLFKYNNTLKKRDTIAYSNNIDTARINAYTLKTLKLSYKSKAIPDTMLLIFTSSTLNGHNGSKVYIDDISADTLTSGIEDHEKLLSCISIYPNPSNGFIVVSRPASQYTAELNILDITGRLQIRAYLSANQSQIKLVTSLLSPGTYILQMQENGRVFATKFVVDNK